MKVYKPMQEKAIPMNTCAPAKLLDDFLVVATDSNLGDNMSKAVQLALKYVIKNKDNKKFMQELKELK